MAHITEGLSMPLLPSSRLLKLVMRRRRVATSKEFKKAVGIMRRPDNEELGSRTGFTWNVHAWTQSVM